MVFESLEPRLLLSADPVSAVDDIGGVHRNEPWPPHDFMANPAVLSSHFQSGERDGRLSAAPDPGLESSATPYLTELPDALNLADLAAGQPNDDPDYSDFDTGPLVFDAATRYELIVVDSQVEDYETLVSNLLNQRSESRQIQVHVLDASRDGIDQMTEILKRFRELDAVHVISHGNEHSFQLGNTWVDANDLDSRAPSIEVWGKAFSEEADLLFYGCNLAASSEGTAFLEAFGKLVGVDVAASTNVPGSASLGGDWKLEYLAGDIETSVAFSASLQARWLGSLGTADPLWISTTGSVTNGGQPGDDTWDDEDIVLIGDPNLALGPATDGTFGEAFDTTLFSATADLNAVHYVTRNLTVGTSDFS